MRELLKNLLFECQDCASIYYDNVALIAEENAVLTDDQIEAVLVELSKKHKQHVH